MLHAHADYVPEQLAANIPAKDIKFSPSLPAGSDAEQLLLYNAGCLKYVSGGHGSINLSRT